MIYRMFAKLIIARVLFFLLTATYSGLSNASMDPSSVLKFNKAAGGTVSNAPLSSAPSPGSWFSMESNPNVFTFVPIGALEGIKLGQVQTPSGSHVGLPNGTESPTIDNAWDFFFSTGMTGSSVPITIVSDDGAGNVTLDMSGWMVAWNGGVIPMGAGANAVVTCAVTCAFGDTFTLDYSTNVPSGIFQGTPYAVHLEGTVTAPPVINTAPVAVNDSFTVNRKAIGSTTYIPKVLDVIANDTDVDGNSDINRKTVIVNPNGTDTTSGTVVIDPVTGNISYTPVAGTLSPPDDTFTYNVTDKGGPTAGTPGKTLLTSNIATVTITIQNAVPVAVDDNASLDTASASSVTIDVTANDTDSDGNIDKTTVNIAPANDAQHGTTTINPITGVVTYTPNAGFIGTDRFKYTVKDNDGVASNLATVVINVSGGVGILPAKAVLLINAGTGKPNQGSYFSMEVSPGKLTTAGIVGFNHLKLGVKQLASAAMPDIDEVWTFFGNPGVDQTTKPISILTDDKKGNVTLDLSGWNVSWNGIPSIPLNNGLDNGIATMTCGKDCSIGDSYSLIYHATVPPGDPSGFGGVHYILHLFGTVAFKAPTVGGGSTAAAYDVSDTNPIIAVDDSASASPNPVTVGAGSIATKTGYMSGIGLTQAEVGKDPLLNDKDGKECIGGCIDFSVKGVTTPFIDLVFKLSAPIPEGASFRKLMNGKWSNFNTSVKDQIGTANADANGNCQGPQGRYNTGLRKGASCVFLRIYDNGPNDTDPTVGVIADPSGVLLAGSPNVPPSSTSGCSISATPVAIQDRADWLIVAIFLSVLGFMRIRRKPDDVK